MVAAKNLHPDFHAWEPESLWLTLERDGVDVSARSRDKIQAGLALLLVPAFYWDAHVYEKTAIAFDQRLSNPDAIEEASSAQLAWATVEASWVLSLENRKVPDFANEPTAYSAVVMHREGLLLAPEQLKFAQETLTRMNHASGGLSTVKDRWAALDKKALETHAFEETEEGVHLARLAAIEMHVQHKRASATRVLATLR